MTAVTNNRLRLAGAHDWRGSEASAIASSVIRRHSSSSPDMRQTNSTQANSDGAPETTCTSA